MIHVYVMQKENRRICYNDVTKKRMPFARYLLETIGIHVPDDWEVHHIDGNPLNDRISNLIPLPKKVHQELHRREKIKYIDKNMICPICLKEFVWKAASQSRYYRGRKVRSKYSIGPCCSKQCTGKAAMIAYSRSTINSPINEEEDDYS